MYLEYLKCIIFFILFIGFWWDIKSLKEMKICIVFIILMLLFFFYNCSFARYWKIVFDIGFFKVCLVYIKYRM